MVAVADFSAASFSFVDVGKGEVFAFGECFEFAVEGGVGVFAAL